MYIHESASATPDAFNVGSNTAEVIYECNASPAWVSIPNNHHYVDVSTGAPADMRDYLTFTTQRCGNVFGPVRGVIANAAPGTIVSDSSTPFVVKTFSHTSNDVIGTGFSLDYHLKPCDSQLQQNNGII